MAVTIGTMTLLSIFLVAIFGIVFVIKHYDFTMSSKENNRLYRLQKSIGMSEIMISIMIIMFVIIFFTSYMIYFK